LEEKETISYTGQILQELMQGCPEETDAQTIEKSNNVIRMALQSPVLFRPRHKKSAILILEIRKGFRELNVAERVSVWCCGLASWSKISRFRLQNAKC
jgi:hypothetical protein